MYLHIKILFFTLVMQDGKNTKLILYFMNSCKDRSYYRNLFHKTQNSTDIPYILLPKSPSMPKSRTLGLI